jgi:hypothetical protein
MTGNLRALIASFSGWPVILDSNLLLLRWCASLDLALLKTFKRLQGFQPNDVVILGEVMAMLGTVKTTPHVLTEVSNLANALPSWKKQGWTNHMAHMAGQIALVEERWEPASQILEDRSMGIFGLTDAALGRLARTHVILSADWPLCNQLSARGLSSINFQALRLSFLSQ